MLHRNVGVLVNRAGSDLELFTAVCALESLSVFVAVNLLCVAAMRTDESIAPSAFFKILPARFLIGKLFEKVEKIVIFTHFFIALYIKLRKNGELSKWL